MYRNIIHQASLEVKKISQEKFVDTYNKNITKKSDGSFVTDVDVTLDIEISTALKRLFPAIHIISEESQPDISTVSGLAWCIDPIDGTHNFMNDIPYYAVSVGLLFDGVPVAGILYDPMTEDIITGGEGLPLMINNKNYKSLNNSFIVTTGRSHLNKDRETESVLVGKILSSKNLKYRRFASCALDLMNLIRGRIGAVIVVGNSPWDWSAGYAIAKHAGYSIEHKDEEHFVVFSSHLKDSLFMII
tara:strand:- start:3743 stop:4477 length:735 start_codon:yes stop_codon:yes gene_type:complete